MINKYDFEIEELEKRKENIRKSRIEISKYLTEIGLKINQYEIEDRKFDKKLNETITKEKRNLLAILASSGLFLITSLTLLPAPFMQIGVLLSLITATGLSVEEMITIKKKQEWKDVVTEYNKKSTELKIESTSKKRKELESISKSLYEDEQKVDNNIKQIKQARTLAIKERETSILDQFYPVDNEKVEQKKNEEKEFQKVMVKKVTRAKKIVRE